MTLKFCFHYLLLLISLLSVTPVVAEEPAESEIHHLIAYVEKSGCVFERNGDEHSSPDAADHLRLKYRRGRRYADTAEAFIDRLASKSSFTGKAYYIQCENQQKQPVGTWLHRALVEYRQANE